MRFAAWGGCRRRAALATGRGNPLGAPFGSREAILQALGDPLSREILLLLNQSPRPASELLRSGSISQSTLYRRLGRLRQAGLIAVQRSIITEEGKKLDLYRSLVSDVDVSLRGSTLEVRARRRDLSAERLADLWDEIRRGGGR